MTFNDLIYSSTLLEIKRLPNESKTMAVTCAYGVDAVPGLAVWRLTHQQGDVQLQPKWDFSSIEWPKERDVERNLFEHRSTTLKQLPVGFVGLLYEMEEFLMDKRNHESEASVVQKWKEILKKFDARALSGFYQFPTDVFVDADDGHSAYTMKGDNACKELKQMLNVCGNCYAICSKLQRLLQSPVEMFVKKSQFDRKFSTEGNFLI